MKAGTVLTRCIITFVLAAQPIGVFIGGQAQAQPFRNDIPPDVSLQSQTGPVARLYENAMDRGIGRSTPDTVTEAWQARYSGWVNQWDVAYAIAVDAAGNVYVTGASEGYGTNYDYATIKYDASGVEQWAARYNGFENSADLAKAIAVDAAGNVYVTGESEGKDTYYDCATVKYDAAGVEQWVARYNAPDSVHDKANALALDADGNVYVTGRSDSSGAGSNYVTIKYNASGLEQWVSRYSGIGGGEDEAYAIVLDASGNVYVTGYCRSLSSVIDYVTIKYDASGAEQWVEYYDGPGSGVDRAYALVTDTAGNVYVTGKSYGGPETSSDYATLKYNSAGVLQWVERYDGPGNDLDEAFAIAVDAAGNIYVTGNSRTSAEDRDYATIKYDASGNVQWVARYNGPENGNDFARAITLDPAGNVYVTGYCYSAAVNVSHYATLKYDPSGVEQWVARYCDVNDRAYAIAVDAAGNVYVTGESLGSEFGWDYITIKYQQGPVSVKGVHKGAPAAFSLRQNYPNPFNPMTTFEYDIPDAAEISLTVYGLNGKKIRTLVADKVQIGNNKAVWDGRDDAGELVGSGIYFYSLKSGNFNVSKKMILVR